MEQKELQSLSKIIKRDKQNIPSDILPSNISQPDCMYTVEANAKYLYIFRIETEHVRGLQTRYRRKKMFQAVNRPFRSILFIAGYRSSIVINVKLHKVVFLSCSEVYVTLREKLSGSCDFIRCSKIIVDFFRQPPSVNTDLCELFKIFQRRKKGLYCVTACKDTILKTVTKREDNSENRIKRTDLSSNTSIFVRVSPNGTEIIDI